MSSFPRSCLGSKFFSCCFGDRALTAGGLPLSFLVAMAPKVKFVGTAQKVRGGTVAFIEDAVLPATRCPPNPADVIADMTAGRRVYHASRSGTTHSQVNAYIYRRQLYHKLPTGVNGEWDDLAEEDLRRWLLSPMRFPRAPPASMPALPGPEPLLALPAPEPAPVSAAAEDVLEAPAAAEDCVMGESDDVEAPAVAEDCLMGKSDSDDSDDSDSDSDSSGADKDKAEEKNGTVLLEGDEDKTEQNLGTVPLEEMEKVSQLLDETFARCELLESEKEELVEQNDELRADNEVLRIDLEALQRKLRLTSS